MGGFGFLILIVAFLFLWLVLVRPQKRRQVEQQRMLSDLRVGDEVLTAGGIYGTIVRLDDSEVVLELAPGLEVRAARRAIAGVPPREAEEDEAGGAGEQEEHALLPAEDVAPGGEDPG
jgi:preprotein translocase subunit YajC